MKKLLIFILSALALSSCFGDEGSYTAEFYLGASFEYTHIDQSVLFEGDSLYFDAAYGLGVGWDDLAFYHKLNEEKTEFKGGFILSALTGEVCGEGYEPDEAVDIYRANAPKDSTSRYLVFRDSADMPEHDSEFISIKYGTCAMIGCRVAVPEYVAYAASEHFTDGDKLTLTVTGYNGTTETGEASIELASCENGKVNVLSVWKTLDLSKLGKIQYMDFDVVSTSPDVPEAFCLDNVVAKVNISY